MQMREPARPHVRLHFYAEPDLGERIRAHCNEHHMTLTDFMVRAAEGELLLRQVTERMSELAQEQAQKP